MKKKRELENKLITRLSSSLVDVISSTRIRPIDLTLTSFLLAISSSFTYYFSRENVYFYFLAGSLLLLSGFLDALDGAVARKKNMETQIGAFLDSTLDKIGEAAVFIGLIASEATTPLLGSLGLASSILISYTRSRAEGLNVDLKGVGLMERAERIVLLVVASFLEPFFRGVINLTMIVLVILSLYTLVQRILYVSRILSQRLS
ncbi:MAG: CDP-alcohol phosphatidyltransferase family protein [Nitrososphaerota archaeon]